MSHGILGCFAHPDDESFGAAGTLALYAQQGIPITLVCATRGEEGEIAAGVKATPETLGAVREEEMRCASAAIGVSELIFLDYRDSGMAGSDANHKESAFAGSPAEAVVPQLVAIIRRLRPAVVLTFDPSGGYGHPDHIAIHRHTLAAVQAALDPARYPALGAPWQVPRLFYVVIPRSFFEAMRATLQAQGQEVAQWAEARGWPDEAVHLRQDVRATLDVKWRALLCHRSQFGEDNPFRKLPDAERTQMMAHENFVLAQPSLAPSERLPSLMP